MDEKSTKQNIKQTVPLLIVSDIPHSVQFYSEGLGFSISEKWESEGKARLVLD